MFLAPDSYLLDRLASVSADAYGSKKDPITGGAGFVGSHLADELLEHGYEVRALDNLTPQVRGERQSRPDYLSDDVELIVGDVRDPVAVREHSRRACDCSKPLRAERQSSATHGLP